MFLHFLTLGCCGSSRRDRSPASFGPTIHTHPEKTEVRERQPIYGYAPSPIASDHTFLKYCRPRSGVRHPSYNQASSSSKSTRDSYGSRGRTDPSLVNSPSKMGHAFADGHYNGQVSSRTLLGTHPNSPVHPRGGPPSAESSVASLHTFGDGASIRSVDLFYAPRRAPSRPGRPPATASSRRGGDEKRNSYPSFGPNRSRRSDSGAPFYVVRHYLFL